MEGFFLASLLFIAAAQVNLTKEHLYSSLGVLIEKLEAKFSYYLLASLYISLVNVAKVLGGKRLEMNFWQLAMSMLTVQNRVHIVSCWQKYGKEEK